MFGSKYLAESVLGLSSSFRDSLPREPSMGFDARPDLACLVLNYKRFHALNSGFFV